MAGSGNRIHYKLRPAKSVERKMIVEALQRLAIFGLLYEEFQYIGLGSFYFADFALIHRALGINEMHSIESDQSSQPRYEFNKPFDCIDIHFGSSNEILSTLNIQNKTVAWLDYDDPINEIMLEDTDYFAGACASGSVLLVTVNVDRKNLQDSSDSEASIDGLVKRVGEAKVPLDLTNKSFQGEGVADVYLQIFETEIKNALSQRSAGRLEGEKMSFKRIFNLRYQDNAKMMTVGWIFFNSVHKKTVEECRFDELPQCNPEGYKIRVPLLTFKEVNYINSKLPGKLSEAKRLNHGIPKAHIEQYAEIYRYFPNYTEVDL